MKVLLATDKRNSSSRLMDAAVAAGWQVISPAIPLERITLEVAALQPDALIVLTDKVTQPVLQQLRKIHLQAPLPVLLLTADNTPDAIGKSIKAGVNAYVAGCSEPARIGHLLEIARARFAEIHAMRAELEATKTLLAERKRIERAKGILMKRRKLEENAAYHLLRKLAMDRNKRIGEIADQIIDTADLLL
jgi:two-component system, response regulator / RNA-binding antiterminator